MWKCFGDILKCFHDNLGKQLLLVEVFDLSRYELEEKIALENFPHEGSEENFEY